MVMGTALDTIFYDYSTVKFSKKIIKNNTTIQKVQTNHTEIFAFKE